MTTRTDLTAAQITRYLDRCWDLFDSDMYGIEIECWNERSDSNEARGLPYLSYDETAVQWVKWRAFCGSRRAKRALLEHMDNLVEMGR